jgi:hypothetical protein
MFIYILFVDDIGYRFTQWCLYARHLAFISIEILAALLVYPIKQQALTPNDHSSFGPDGITWSTSPMAHKTNPNSRFLIIHGPLTTQTSPCYPHLIYPQSLHCKP